MVIKTFIGGVQKTVSDVFGLPVNPGSPVTGTPILIADNLAAGTYDVALDGTGLRGYYLQYTTGVGTTTMDFQCRAHTSQSYINFTTQKSLTVLANGMDDVVPDTWFVAEARVPLPPDCQVHIVVAAGATCTARLIPIPA